MYKLTNTGQEVQDALNAVLEKSAGGHLKEATTSSSGLMSAADKQRLRDQEGEIDAIDQATQRAQAKAEAAFTRAGEAMTHSINLSEKRVNGQQLKYGVDLTGEDIPVNPVTKDTVAQALGKRVEITLRINGKQLNEDVTLTASDIDAGGKSIMDRLQDLIAGKVDNTIRINNYVLNKSVNLSAQDINLTKDSGKSIYDFIMALDTNKVNKTTAINGQPLTGNVTLTGEDIPSLAIQDYPTVDEALHRLDGDKADLNNNQQSIVAQEVTVDHVNTNSIFLNGNNLTTNGTDLVFEGDTVAMQGELDEKVDKNDDWNYYDVIEQDVVTGSFADANFGNPFAIQTAHAQINSIKKNKQDKLVSGTNIKTINGESIVGSGDITIEGGTEEIYIGTGTPPEDAKIAINPNENFVSIEQTTGQATDKVMSQKAVTDELAKKQHTLTAGENITIENNVISSNGALRPLFIAAGAVYNSTTGYYELNGLTDITEAEMMAIYSYTNTNVSSPWVAGQFAGTSIRTNLQNYSEGIIGSYQSSGMEPFISCSKIEVINAVKSNDPDAKRTMANDMVYTFYGCIKLKKIIGSINVNNCTLYNKTFDNCLLLEEVKLKKLKANISFAQSPNLSKESILYMINNENATSAITITLHPTAYAMAQADTEIQTALSNHPFVTLASE